LVNGRRPGLRNAKIAQVGMVDDEARNGRVAFGPDSSDDRHNLFPQRVMWVYNPHNLRIIYRYYSIALALSQ
jgi:hypothetical protein